MRRKSGRSIFRWLEALLLIVGAPLLFIGLIELTLFLFNFQTLKQDPSITGWETHSAMLNRCEFATQEEVAKKCSPFTKNANKKNVLAFGGSSLVWSFDPKEPNFIDLANRKIMDAKEDVVIINYGTPCKDSYFVKHCYNRVRSLGHESVFVYVGHNDVINAGYVNTDRGLVLKKLHRFRDIIFALQDNSRVYAVVAKAWSSLGIANSHYSNMQLNDLKEAQKKILVAYERNLRDVIKMASEEGSEVILGTLISNLYEREPGAYSPKDFFTDDSVYLEAREMYKMAQDSLAKNRWREAYEYFSRARDLDPQGDRAYSGMNDVVRKLATEYEHVKLIDFERVFYERYAKESIGCNLFQQGPICDHIHPNIKAKKLMGKLLSLKIIELD